MELTLSHVVERDIDLLVVEELTCSTAFQWWFFGMVDEAWRRSAPTGVVVRHSVSASGPGSGETDILVSAQVNGLRVHLHLENKVHSPFTERQPQRYQERAAAATVMGECDVFRCVLLCPAGYAASSCGFDVTVTYEQIAQFLKQRASTMAGEPAARNLYRASVIEQAIGRFRRGYVSKPVAEVTTIWGVYFDIASREFPELRMSAPGEKPGDSYSVSFPCLQQHPLLPRCRIEHVMERGTVTLLLNGWADRRSKLTQHLDGHLPASAFLRDAGKSLGITLRSTPIARMEAARQQIPAMRAAMEQARVLKAWYEQNWQMMADKE